MAQKTLKNMFLALLEVEHRKDEKDIIMIEFFLGGAISYIYIYIYTSSYIHTYCTSWKNRIETNIFSLYRHITYYIICD